MDTMLSWAENGSAGRLVKDLVAFVHHLDVLCLPHFAVGVRRSAVTNDTREWDAGKIEDRRWECLARVDRASFLLHNAGQAASL